MNRDDLARKADLLQKYLEELESIGAVSFEEYEADNLTRRSVERLIELVVECATDINTLLIFEAGRPTPTTYYDSFMKLSDIGLLRASIAKQMASIAGLRNRLAHDYEDIDNRIVYNNIARILKIFPVYLAAVRKRIEAD